MYARALQCQNNDATWRASTESISRWIAYLCTSHIYERDDSMRKTATKNCFVNGDNLSHALLAKQSGTRHNVERSYLAMTPLGMARRGRRRVIEGNERLPLITPCLLSGVHTCFRNILPAVYNQAALSLSLSPCREAGNRTRFQGCPGLSSWILTHMLTYVYRTESFDKAVCRGTLARRIKIRG